MKGAEILSKVKYRVTVKNEPGAVLPAYTLESLSFDKPLPMPLDRLTLVMDDKRKLDFTTKSSDPFRADVTNAIYS